MQLRERLLGPHHAETLKSSSKLATVLDRLGMLGDAEQLHRRVLEGRTQELGEE